MKQRCSHAGHRASQMCFVVGQITGYKKGLRGWNAWKKQFKDAIARVKRKFAGKLNWIEMSFILPSSHIFLGVSPRVLSRACIVIMAWEYVPFYALHGEVPRERGPFLKLQVYKRKEISLAEVYERVAVNPCRSFHRPQISRLDKSATRLTWANRRTLWLWKKTSKLPGSVFCFVLFFN